MADRPPWRTRSSVVVVGLAAAAAAIVGAGFWAMRGGPGDAPPHGANGREAPADPNAPEPAIRLRSPDTGDPLIGAFEQRIRARLASHPAPSRPLSGSLAITTEDLVWREPGGGAPPARGDGRRGRGRVFARADAVSASLELEGLAQGDVRVHDGTLTGVEVNLRESPAGWNHDVVLAGLLDGDDAGAAGRAATPRVARLDDVTIRRGTLRVRTLARSFALDGLDAELREVAFSGPSLPEPRIVVARANADLEIPGEQPIPLTVADATARVLTDTVSFDVDRATIVNERLADIRGDWSSSIPVFGVLAQGRAVDVSLEGVQRFLPDQAPRTGTASFSWSIEESAPAYATKSDPRLGRIDITLSDLDVVAENSDVTGRIAFQVGENADRVMLLDADLSFEPLDVRLVEVFAGPLPFAGTATGTIRGPADDLAFALAAHLTIDDVADPLVGSVTGRIGVTPDDGVLLHGADAMLDAVPLAALRHWAPGLPLAGTASGRVTLSGPPGLAPLSLDLDLALAAGDATVVGTVDLTGDVPAYDLSGTLTAIDIAQLMEPDAPPVLLDSRFALEGTGIRPAELNATLDLDGEFRGWRAVQGDGFAVNARARAGVLAVDTAWARLADAAASMEGEWRFVTPVSGDVRYSATVASLEPWGPYVPLVGDSSAAGSVDLTGTLEGSLDRPRLSAQLHGSDLRLGSWAASSLEAAYAVVLGGAIPRGAIEVRASGVETPLAEDYRSLALSASLATADLAFTLNAERSDGGGIAIEATGNIPDFGPREIIAERVDVDLGENRWSLTDSASFRWNDGAGVVVDRFEMREEADGGVFRVAGTLLPLDDLDVDLEVAGLPVEEIEDLLGRERLVTGELGLTAHIEGPGSAPTADVEFQLENGSIDSLAITRFDGTLSYAADRLSATADATMDGGSFELDVELPAVIDFSADRKFELAESGAVSASLVARSVSITPFQRLSWRIQDLRGRIDGEIDVAGSIADPTLTGQLVLTGGAVRVPELRTEFSNVAGQIVLNGSRVSIESFAVESDGIMTASGGVTFDDLTDPTVDVSLSFDEFRPLGVPGGRKPAALFGDVSIDGPMDEIVITGEVRVADGDIVIPSSGPPSAEEEFGDLPEVAADGTPVAPTPPDPSPGLTIEDLVVRLDRDVWVDAEAARAQLSGELVLNRTDDRFEIEGTLAGERGTFTLEAGPIVRRFEILSAELTFRPETPELDPSIDVLARRYIFDPSAQRLDVEVRIGGTLSQPTLALASPNAPRFAQPELLSILLFDRPTLRPGSGEVAGEVLEGSIAELASLELEQAFVRDLGVSIDVFQVRFGGGGIGGFGNPTFVIGVELARDVFLTAETAVGGLFSATDATANAWALRVEWAFRRNSRLRVSLEPVTQSAFLRGYDLGFQELSQKQQLSFDLRRRWSY